MISIDRAGDVQFDSLAAFNLCCVRLTDKEPIVADFDLNDG